MESKSNGHGGVRPNSGRKRKAEEAHLIEQLTPYDEVALKALIDGVQTGDYQFVKLFMEYRFGKPSQAVDHTTNGESLNLTPISFISTGDKD